MTTLQLSAALLIAPLFAITLIGLAVHRTHLLSALLCLECSMLIIFLGMTLHTQSLSPRMLPLVVLTLSACDAGLGLSLMVATARTQNSDNLKTLNLIKW
uniref:NADH-ubiquinone oxidoreductase chain 4L n=1 Tax=Ptychadena mascareniensis TaxID=88031 RepID=S4V056_9NEOB|nr:NADH dehydrogenase subunit 4L [Ptychadena mascareniensis]